MAAVPLIRPVILSGGSGTRLWPLSRRRAPKQYQALTSDRSLFRETLDRVSDRRRFDAPLIVCNHEHAEQAEKELAAAGVGDARIVLEPCARNTAPAIVAACLLEAEEAPDRPLLFLPSDHWTARPQALSDAVLNAAGLATAGSLVLFGIRPDRIETGYGYIRMGEAVGGGQAYRVASFVEKPHRDVALTMIAQGQHVWNSGIFLFTPSALLAEVERLQPAIAASCRTALARASRGRRTISPDAEAFAGAQNLSIDHAVMERTSHAVVVPVDPGWSDVGSWPALYELLGKDSDGNAVSGRTIVRRTRRCLVRGSRRLIATVGVEDLVIVDTDDALLIAHHDAGQDVRAVVEQLTRKGAREADHPPVESSDGVGFRTLAVPPGQDVTVDAEAGAASHLVVLSGCIETDGGQRSGNGDCLSVPAQGARIRNPGTSPAMVGLLTVPLSPAIANDAPGRTEGLA